MSIYNLRVRPADGRSAVYRYEYTLRIDGFSWEKNSKYDDFLFSENMNMPLFASEDNKKFWEACEKYERLNANNFRTIDFSLLTELTDEENIELASNFAKELFKEKFVYSLAVHSKPSSKENVKNIHCHIMFSERELDGIERSPENFFKRYNSKNPENGGCKKNQEWTSLSKLYYIRQTWEKLANEKLKEKNLELISSKSLKDQRVDSIIEENYLRAELLDRPPIHLEKSYIDFCPDSKEKEKAVEFFNYAKQLKEIKEKTFKLKCENFEEENQKAKERFLKEIGAIEGREYNSSDFDISENIVDEHFNFENVFLTSIENNILLEKKEGRLKQLNSITNEDIQNRALNIVSNGEYPKNLSRLKEIESFYNSMQDKANFKFEEERNELKRYFENLKNDEAFNIKISNMMYKISTKMEAEKENIITDLEFLRHNNFRDFHLEKTAENKLRTQEFYQKTLSYISDLKAQKEKQDKKVNEYKEYLKRDIRYELYEAIKPETAEKYLELLEWKKEYKEGDNTDLENRIELAKRIKSRELGFKKFDIENNINEKYEKELAERRGYFKNLRQNQDDINGKLSYSFMMLEELKKVKSFELIEEENLLSEKAKNIQSNFEKYEYNVRLSLLKEEHLKLFKTELDMNEFYVVPLSEKEKSKYRDNILMEINYLQKELKDLSEKIIDKNITDEDLKFRILDKETKGNYSKYKTEISYYKKQIEKGLSVPENDSMLKQALKVIDKIEKDYVISSEQLQREKQLINENNIKVSTKISSIKEKLKVNFKLLKGMKTKPKVKKVKPRKNYNHYAGRLKVARTGKIEIKDETEERERVEKWENEL